MAAQAIVVVRQRVSAARRIDRICRVTSDARIRRTLVNATFVALEAIKRDVSAAKRVDHGVTELRLLPQLLTVTVVAIRKCAAMDVVFLVAENTVLARAGKSTIINVALIAI